MRLPQAEVRHVGPGWDIPSKAAPGVNPPLGPAPIYTEAPRPLPPQPTEAELRSQLAAAIDAQKAADATVQAAQEANERGLAHVQRCRAALARHIDIDARITDHTVAQLKNGKDDAALPDDLANQLAARDRARTDLLAAENAAAILLRELSAASQEAGNAAKAVEMLVCRVLSFKAGTIADDCRMKLAEVEATRRTLLGFDKMATAMKVPMPGAISSVIGEVDARAIYGADITPWQRAADALRSDPHAAVAIDVPAAIVPQLPPLSGRSVTKAVPIPPPPQDDGDPGYVPAEEQP
jgi:hypothetical protein